MPQKDTRIGFTTVKAGHRALQAWKGPEGSSFPVPNICVSVRGVMSPALERKTPGTFCGAAGAPALTPDG